MLTRILLTLATLILTAAASAAAPSDCAQGDVLGTSRILPVSVKDHPRVGLKSFPTTLPLQDKEVVLTFDDGPFPPTTRRVLDALSAQCVRASFFLIGQNAAHNPELVRRIAADGHTLAFHTWSHRILGRISEAAAQDEIMRGISAVESSANGAHTAGNSVGAATSEPPRLFRFPGFVSTPNLLDFANAHNMLVFGTDFWVSDWNPMSPEQEFRQLVDRLKTARKGIVLLHDIKASTAAMLPRFLRYLKDNGYRIVHVVPGETSEPHGGVR